jgi:hypothetical protein
MRQHFLVEQMNGAKISLPGETFGPASSLLGCLSLGLTSLGISGCRGHVQSTRLQMDDELLRRQAGRSGHDRALCHHDAPLPLALRICKHSLSRIHHSIHCCQRENSTLARVQPVPDLSPNRTPRKAPGLTASILSPAFRPPLTPQGPRKIFLLPSLQQPAATKHALLSSTRYSVTRFILYTWPHRPDYCPRYLTLPRALANHRS